MIIRSTIQENGDITLVGVSTLEALWHDYLHFKRLALLEPSTEPAFQQKRYLRAALMLFVAHVSGVVDDWCRRQLTSSGVDGADQKGFFQANRCMELKCSYLSKQANLAGIGGPDFEFKGLRNRIAHVQQGEDLELFDALTPELLENAERDVLEWLDLIGSTLGYERIANVKERTEQFAEDLRSAGIAVKTAVDEPSLRQKGQ